MIKPAAGAIATQAAQSPVIALRNLRGVVTRELCPDRGIPGEKRCMAHAVTHTIEADQSLKRVADAEPQGYGPNDIRSAYNLPSTGGSGKWVAVVDAYYYPDLEKDLNTYRSQYGIPPCTKANGCLKEYFADNNGETSTPPAQDKEGVNGWAGELMLDVDMISAACPQCGIMVVEAASPDDNSLFVGAKVAAAHGAAAISNSFGGPEDETVASNESYYDHPGILITASSGDSGYGASYPATSAFVLAIGGTTLNQGGGGRGWTETAWSRGGSGCSARVATPSWQSGKTDSGCKNRMESDISAVADPKTGVAIYAGGWKVIGGTSASSPIVAAAFTALRLSKNAPSFVYSNTSAFYDVTDGSNGICFDSYQCNAGAGYDGPTGWGTPNGTALAALGTPACTSNSSCKAPTPACNTSTGDCVACVKSSDCTDPTKPTCDTATNTCRACASNADCSTGTCITASGDPRKGQCVECTSNAQCSNPKPVCSTSKATCGPCQSNADCAGNAAGSFCNGGSCGPRSTETDAGSGSGPGSGSGSDPNPGIGGGGEAPSGDQNGATSTGSSGGCSVGVGGGKRSFGAVGMLLGIVFAGARFRRDRRRASATPFM